eukprot:2981-Heterococcus_DN1.PRE.1
MIGHSHKKDLDPFNYVKNLAEEFQYTCAVLKSYICALYELHVCIVLRIIYTAASTYLKKARRRHSLTTETQAHATKILFEGERAVGIEYVQNGEKRAARIDAHGEVLMCGGAINTPQLTTYCIAAVVATQEAGQQTCFIIACDQFVKYSCSLCAIRQLVAVTGGTLSSHCETLAVLRNCYATVFETQLLMLSGVGPAAHLESKGIKVIKNIAEIGQNLQDHPAVTVMNDISKPIAITDKIFQKGTGKCRAVCAACDVLTHLGLLLTVSKTAWFLTGTGPLTSPGCDYGGFIKSHKDAPQPDLQLRFVPGRAENPDGVQAYKAIGDSGQFNSGVTIQ